METSALQSVHEKVSSDIFPGVFDWMFEDVTFQRWRQGQCAWQLHCIGGPGSGKTTLTTLISKHLKQHFKREQYPVVTLQITDDVQDHQTDLVEDFLEAVYQQLAECPNIQSSSSLHCYNDYRLAADSKNTEGTRRRERLRLIRTAIHMQLNSSNDLYAYLILDGIDRCGSTLRFLLESELADLQERGMRILLTSRLAVFENEEVTCDHEHHGDTTDDNPLIPTDRRPLSIYLQCKTCDETVICFPCKMAERFCSECDADCQLYEPYQHVNLRMSVSPEAMTSFITWDLEREHGDLGLDSSARKPPLSCLGESLLLNRGTKPIQTIIEDIVELSYGNIGIAKARLDLLHDMESLEGLESRKDQLPTPVTALFDYGLKQIEALPARQRDIALKCIAAAGRSVFGTSIPDLRAILEMLGILGVRSGEEIIEATRGWLNASTREDPQRLQVYNTNFMYYVKQRYHQALHRSSVQIDSHEQQRRGLFDAENIGLSNTARFEPQDVSETPTSVTPYKLARTTTTMPAIEEAPVHPFIIRKGTVAWT